MGCGQKSFKLVWQCLQLLSKFLAQGHLPRMSLESHHRANDKGDIEMIPGTLVFALLLRKTSENINLRIFKNRFLIGISFHETSLAGLSLWRERSSRSYKENIILLTCTKISLDEEVICRTLKTFRENVLLVDNIKRSFAMWDKLFFICSSNHFLSFQTSGQPCTIHLRQSDLSSFILFYFCHCPSAILWILSLHIIRGLHWALHNEQLNQYTRNEI